MPPERRNNASAVVDPAGAGPRLFFQRVPERKQVKNRVHLDLRAAPGLQGEARMAALEAEAERLVGHGATRLQRYEPAPRSRAVTSSWPIRRATSSAWTDAAALPAGVRAGRLNCPAAGAGSRRASSSTRTAPAVPAPGGRRAAQEGRQYDRGVLEAVYLTLLCLSALTIAWFAVFVVYRLFKGQR